MEREYPRVNIKTFVLPALLVTAGLTAGPAEAHHRHAWSDGNGGLASWYGPGFNGHRTASGERFNTGAFTAAHRFFPFGTRVLVTNRRNGRSVEVRINDRGPFAPGRVIDLSYAASRAIGMQGTDPVILARR